jgi:hypothetical protein
MAALDSLNYENQTETEEIAASAHDAAAQARPRPVQSLAAQTPRHSTPDALTADEPTRRRLARSWQDWHAYWLDPQRGGGCALRWWFLRKEDTPGEL